MEYKNFSLRMLRIPSQHIIYAQLMSEGYHD